MVPVAVRLLPSTSCGVAVQRFECEGGPTQLEGDYGPHNLTVTCTVMPRMDAISSPQVPVPHKTVLANVVPAQFSGSDLAPLNEMGCTDLVVQYGRTPGVDGSSPRCDAVAGRLGVQAMGRHIMLAEESGACEPVMLFSESTDALGLDDFRRCMIVLHLCTLDWLVEKRIMMADGSAFRPTGSRQLTPAEVPVSLGRWYRPFAFGEDTVCEDALMMQVCWDGSAANTRSADISAGCDGEVSAPPSPARLEFRNGQLLPVFNRPAREAPSATFPSSQPESISTASDSDAGERNGRKHRRENE